MIAVHGECQCCGRRVASVEVVIPHASRKRVLDAGGRAGSLFAVQLCKACAQAAAAAWAAYEGKAWRTGAELARELKKPRGG